jgi:hypothetical protein
MMERGPSFGGRSSGMLPLSYLGAAEATWLPPMPPLPWLAPELSGHYYHPRVLALTHTVTLGWITMSILGASYQLIPIVLERPLWSERLARWQLGVLLIGVSGMIAHFWIGTWPALAGAAALVGLGAGMHVVNVALSLRDFGRWTFTARLVVLGHVGLSLTIFFGFALALNHLWPFLPGEFFPTLHAHVHLALAWWIAPMLMGVSARVYPMFLLAPEPRGWPGRIQLWGLAVGAPFLVTGLLAAPGLIAPGAAALAAAAAGHVVWVVSMARGRKRPRLDWGLRLVLTAASFLPLGTVLGLALAFDLLSGPRVALAYAVLVLGGWASLSVVGMMLKIVPFLVWYRVYGPQAGRAQVPTLAALGWPAAEAAAWALLTAGILALALAAAIGRVDFIAVSGVVLATGALAFAASLGHTLLHLVGRPSARATKAEALAR